MNGVPRNDFPLPIPLLPRLESGVQHDREYLAFHKTDERTNACSEYFSHSDASNSKYHLLWSPRRDETGADGPRFRDGIRRMHRDRFEWILPDEQPPP